jgi:SAM-dependent methyltransferase
LRLSSPGYLVFICNICGALTSACLTDIAEREKATCSNCQSSLRFRSVIAAFQERLLGKVMPLLQLPVRKEVAGLGMSDDKVYSTGLAEKFNYTNTFYHKEPYLDITDPDPRFHQQFDFVISSDVMEHVKPPIEVAFRNLRSLLRPSGLLVLSTPFAPRDRIIEHFPELHQFEIIGTGTER